MEMVTKWRKPTALGRPNSKSFEILTESGRGFAKKAAPVMERMARGGSRRQAGPMSNLHTFFEDACAAHEHGMRLLGGEC